MKNFRAMHAGYIMVGYVRHGILAVFAEHDTDPDYKLHPENRGSTWPDEQWVSEQTGEPMRFHDSVMRRAGKFEAEYVPVKTRMANAASRFTRSAATSPTPLGQ